MQQIRSAGGTDPALGRAIARAAAGWIGTPWLRHGRDRAGMDCLGLVLVACRGAGLELPDPFTSAGMRWAGWRPHVRILEAGERPEPGDLVEVGLRGPASDHVALVALDRRTVWHASEGIGVCRTPTLRVKVLGYRRFLRP